VSSGSAKLGIRYPVSLKIPTGGAPEKDRTGANGQRLFRKWQRGAFGTLRRRKRRILVGPTGSGKSLVVEGLALQDLLDGCCDKAIVAVPQSIIASSFDGGGQPFQLPSGQTVRWEPGHRLIETDDVVARLRGFLTRPLKLTRTNPERILVCSHAALVAYHNKFHTTAASDWSDYEGVALSIDEAHHVRCPDDDVESEDDADDAARNKLGRLIGEWLGQRKVGPLTMVTATWFRTDQIAIIPPDRYASFTRYNFSIADYLKSLTYLKEIEIRFLNGAVEDCVEHCYREDPDANTLVYIRPVAPGRDKFKERDRLVRRLGLPKAHFVDLVAPWGRTDRKNVLIDEVATGGWNLGNEDRPPRRWIFALMLGREGFDLPSLQRSIVIGPRQSMQVIVQMLGRLLRDHPGKEKVQFNIVLPFRREDMSDGVLLQRYMKVMLGTLALGAILWPPMLDCVEDRGTFTAVTADGPGKLHRALSVIAEAISDDPVEDAPAFIDELIRSGKIDLEAGSSPASLRRVMLALVQRHARAAQNDLLMKMPTPALSVDDFAGLRMWRLAFGHESLSRLASATGNQPPFTWEAARQAIVQYIGNAEVSEEPTQPIVQPFTWDTVRRAILDFIEHPTDE